MKIAIVLISIAVLCPASGCHFSSMRGPVSRALDESREFCQRGLEAFDRGEWTEAESALAEAVRACPDDPEARRHYAEALWKQGDSAGAMEQLDAAIRLGEEDANLRVFAAEMRFHTGQLDSAYESAQRAIDRDPKLASAWAIRGRIMRARGQPRQALADFHRALALDADASDVSLEVAELYRELNQPDRALAVLQQLGNAWPPGEEPQRVLFLKGRAYSALARFDDAARSFDEAGRRGPQSPEILYCLAEAELMASRPHQAAAAASEALSLDPAHQPSRQLLAGLGLAPGVEPSLLR